jgi:hypothetical protein
MADPTHLQTVTIDHYLKLTQDNFFSDDSQVVMNSVLGSPVEKTGLSIKQPHNYAGLNNAGVFDAYGEYDTDNNQKKTRSTHYWGTFQGSITSYDFDEAVNAPGPSQIINNIKEEFDILDQSLKDAISTKLILGVRSTDAIASLDGFGVAIPTAANTYGELDRSVDTWYDCNRGTMTGSTLNVAELWTEYMKCVNGNDGPTDIYTTRAMQGYYHNLLTPMQMLSNTQTGDASFTKLNWYNIPIKMDDNIPAGYLYFFNSKYSRAYKLPKWYFTMGEKKRHPRKEAYIQTVRVALCWFITRPKRFGVISGVTG